MENTTISWARHSWSPWIGCQKVHAGCDHCYAESQGRRLGVTWGPGGTRRVTSDGYWSNPLKWNRAAAGDRPRIFPSLCDPFEDWRAELVGTEGIPLKTCLAGCVEQWAYDDRCPACGGPMDLVTMADVRKDMFGIIDKTPNLDWLLLTKRPGNILRMWPGGPRKNVWLLYSASDQETLEAGVFDLLECRRLVPVLGLSLEPLLGSVDLTRVARQEDDWVFLDNVLTGFRAHKCGGLCGPRKLDWAIVGGESGPNCRECDLDALRAIVGQCREAGAPCFVKQDSGPKPGLRGRIPDALWQVKEFPKIKVGGG